jgi:CheY-like chemotaxis protein
MDDEEIILVVVAKLLAQCGFDSDVSRNGDEMLNLYRQAMESGNPYSAVIMDLVIEGGMNGKEAIHYLLEMDPDATPVVSSGYSNDPVMSNYRTYGFKGFLAKPYRIEDLNRTLREVISGANRV